MYLPGELYSVITCHFFFHICDEGNKVTLKLLAVIYMILHYLQYCSSIEFNSVVTHSRSLISSERLSFMSYNQNILELILLQALIVQ